MEAPPADDSDLRQPLAAQHEPALAKLFERHRSRLMQIARFRTDNRLAAKVDAEDVLQESYLAAAKRLVHYDPDRFPAPFVWLRAVLLQTMTDLYRKHVAAAGRDPSREQALHTPGNAMVSTMAMQLVDSLTSPSVVAARDEAMERVRSAVESMDETDREVLALRHFEELANHEVAQALGISVKTASIRYMRALRRLRAMLDDPAQPSAE